MTLKELSATIERDICRVLERTANISREDLNYLFKAESISRHIYHSRAYDRTQRLTYLLRNLVHDETKEEDAAKYTHLVIVISTDPAAPITEEELGRGFDILDYILYQCPNPDAEVLWEFGTKEGLGDEAELLVLKSY